MPKLELPILFKKHQMQGAPEDAPRRVHGTYASKHLRSNAADGLFKQN
jgi:hypothetical protein